MSNRVMKAKVRKLKMQNRALPRRLSIQVKGPRPAMEVLAQYRERARGLGKEMLADKRYKNLSGHELGMGLKLTVPQFEIMLRSEEILKKFDNPMFVQARCDTVMRLRLFFDASRTKWSIEQIHYMDRMVRVSPDFPTREDAVFAIKHNCVPWETEQPFQYYRDQAEKVAG